MPKGVLEVSTQQGAVMRRRKSSLTLRQAYEQFHKESHEHKPRSIEEYRGAISHWERLMGAELLVQQVDNAALELFRQRLSASGSGLSVVTVAKILREVQAILSTLGPAVPGNPSGLGLIRSVPCVRKPKVPRKEVVSATVPQVQEMYAACQGLCWPRWGGSPDALWRCLIVYLFTVGSRRNEWLNLLWEDVDLQDRQLRITPLKGGVSPVKPICGQLLEVMQPLATPCRARWFDFPDNRKQLYGVWHEIQKRAGIWVDRRPGERRRPYFGFHELRATAATQLANFSLTAAASQLGHASSQTTTKHYINGSQQAAEAVENLPRVADSPPPHSSPPVLRLFTG